MSEFNIVTVESQPILYVHRTSAIASDAIGACMSEAFCTLVGFVGQHGIRITGTPLAIYHSYDQTETTFDVAVPVSAADAGRAAGHADIKAGKTYAGRALKAVHTGPYAKLAGTYDRIMLFMEQQGLKAAGPCWEVYLNDPDTVPEAELITEIYFPLD